MKVAIASDHAGFQTKVELDSFLRKLGHTVNDFGTDSTDSVDYPDFAKLVAKSVSSQKADVGVLVCGSGIGMAITANRFKNVRAVVVNDAFDAEMSRRHNNANVACFGARKTSVDKAKELLAIWLKTPFEGGRHEGRVKKMD
jgi:ribose 5-phosphate isomerase B